MNINQVISFIYVNRFKSFLKAADKLYITQPSLSSRIKALEKELDVQLFNRNSKFVEITSEGETFLPYANQIFNSYLKAKNSLSTNDESLTIGSIISVSMSILPKVIYDFQQNYGNSIEVVTAKTSTIIDKLLKEECQVAITESVSHPKIISEPIYQDTVSLFVSPSHPFAILNRPVTLEEIALEPLICFNSSSDYWQEIVSKFKSYDLVPNIVYRIDSLEAAKSSVLKDIGVCFLPELSLENDINNGYLIRISIENDFEIKRVISLSHSIETSDEIKHYTEFILQEFKK